MDFKPLYYEDQLEIVNPLGFVAIVTLWSSVGWVADRLRELNAHLSTEDSPVAVIGNLRGNGFPHFLRNLAYNPQIRILAVCGKNRSHTQEDLVAYFQDGLIEMEGDSPYILEGETVPAYRITGRKRMIDGLLKPGDIVRVPEIVCLGNLKEETSRKKAKDFFSEIFRTKMPVSDELSGNISRKNIPLPKVHIVNNPCNPRAFTILSEDVVTAWEELIFVLYRFGREVRLPKGKRKELQNIKVVVENPVSEPDPALEKYWFSVDDINRYRHDMINDTDAVDVSYTYAQRMRTYFGIDALEMVSKRLTENREDRKCYISLWDTGVDLSGKKTPCLTALYFRLFENRLTLSAAYRTHNALDAWIYNFYGLKAALDFVSLRTGHKPGAITVVSQSISLDMDESAMARAALLAEKSGGPKAKSDPHGNLCVSVDRSQGEIVVQHMTRDGLLIREYRGKKAVGLQRYLARDLAVSTIHHAMYVGRQLEKAELSLRYGFEFVQD